MPTTGETAVSRAEVAPDAEGLVTLLGQVLPNQQVEVKGLGRHGLELPRLACWPDDLAQVV